MQKLIFLFLGIAFLHACQSHQDISPIKLNSGDKWEVNAEMRPHIEMGSQILSNYLANGDNNYKSLAESLKNQNDQLIKSCTMKGESHDELHKWLHPHMNLITELAEASDAKAAETIVAQLEQSFKTYHNFFK